MAKLKVFTLDNLTLYDELIKGYIDAADAAVDAKSLKTVAITGNTLNFYNVAEPVGETAPVYSIELPQTDLTDVLTRLSALEDGKADKSSVYTKDEVDAAIEAAGYDDTQIKSDIKANADAITAINDEEDGILAQANAYADSKDEAIAAAKKAGDDAQVDVDALEAKIGTVEDGKTVMGIIADIQANAYDDTQVKADIKDNTDAIAAINNAETGILAQSKEYTNTTVAKAVADAKKAVEESLATTQGDLDTLEEKVAGMYTNEQIDKAIADADAELQKAIDANAEAIEAHKTAVDDKVTTLVGEDTGKSVRTIANEELAAQLIGENAKESLDTLEEIAAWIQNHPDDASAMNKAIEDLTALVGVLPEDVTATTIAGYVAEVIAAEKARAEGIEGGLDTRLQAVETAIGEGGSVDAQIDAKIAELDADITSAAVEEGKGVQVQVVEVDGKLTSVVVTGNYNNAYDAKGAAETAETNAKTHATNLNTAMDTRVTELESKVGDGFEAISTDEINAMFTS